MNVFQQDLLKDEIKQAIEQLGFETPTPIQQMVIPHILNTKGDLVALAQTGTGKTAAFGLPIIQNIDTNNYYVQALILAPTRELAQQIAKDLLNYSKFLQKIDVATIYGGANISNQISQIRKGVQIVVGTPGRTLDLINRNVLDLSAIKFLVLDEADEMLNMGFKDELDAILSDTPDDKQTLLFSATMPDEVRQISKKYLKKPEEISAGKVNVGAESVEHHLYLVNQTDKYAALRRVIDFYPDIYALIFCRTRDEAKQLATKLMDDGYTADALHGDLSQAQRDFVMYRFRIKQLKLLIATDVAARGLDISDLTHVINYTLPDDHEIYIHRSGRTGRAGKTGISVVISSSRDEKRIRYIEKTIGKRFFDMKVPSGTDICNVQLFHLIENIKNTNVDEHLVAPFIEKINNDLNDLDKMDLVKKIISIEFNRLLENYKNSKDITVSKSKQKRDDFNDKNDKRERGSQKKSQNRANFQTLEINIGRKDRIKPNNIIGIINEATDSNDIEIGAIQITENSTFFEVDQQEIDRVIDSLKGQKFGGTKIKIGIAKYPAKDFKKEPKREFRKDFDRKKSFSKSRSRK